MILELRGQVLCQLLMEGRGWCCSGVACSNHPPKIWCCHCWKRHVGFCKTNLLCPTNTKNIEKNSSFNAQKVQTITFRNHVKLPLKGRSMCRYVLSFLSVLFCSVDFYVPSSKRHQTNLQSPGCCWRLCLIQLRMPRNICKAYLEALKQGGISGRSLSSKMLKPKNTHARLPNIVRIIFAFRQLFFFLSFDIKVVHIPYKPSSRRSLSHLEFPRPALQNTLFICFFLLTFGRLRLRTWIF